MVADQDPVTLSGLGLTRSGPPSERTLRRILTALDAEVLDRVLGAWMWTRTTTTAGRRVIAIDGKTVRGARTRRVPDGDPADGVASCRRTTVAPHLVAAYDHDMGPSLDRSRSLRRATRSLQCNGFWNPSTSPAWW